MTHHTILVTGGAGFIGSNLILRLALSSARTIINLDKLTYAANPRNLSSLASDPRHILVRGDIGDRELIAQLLSQYHPQAIINLAAESHVDRSIYAPDDFVRTNIVGTFALLEETRKYMTSLSNEDKRLFRFLHVSTDEVFGSLRPDDPASSETSPYMPNSPYSASKAAADHLVRAYHQTYHLPTLTTNCSNNYGPFQFPEKLIPLMIRQALKGETLPIYGDGQNIRDWLFVEDHCIALLKVLECGLPGETYNIGGGNEKRNVEVVNAVCDLLDELTPRSDGLSYRMQISFVSDRPGHDRRYAIDSSKTRRDIGWEPRESFESGIRKTVIWYLENEKWLDEVASGSYRDWIEHNYAMRGST